MERERLRDHVSSVKPMAGITEKIQLFSQAYKSAWAQVSANDQLTEKQRSQAGTILRDAIQRSIKAGNTDVRVIVAEAVTNVLSNANKVDGKPGSHR